MNRIHIEEVENGFIVTVDGSPGAYGKQHVFNDAACLAEFIAEVADEAEIKREAKDVKA